MVLFGFTQCRCELHLRLVSHVLLWEQQNRVLVYRCMQLCYFFTGKRTGQVDAIYARTEVAVKRFELHVNQLPTAWPASRSAGTAAPRCYQTGLKTKPNPPICSEH